MGLLLSVVLIIPKDILKHAILQVLIGIGLQQVCLLLLNLMVICSIVDIVRFFL